ncbi:hypothetical protein FRC03_009532 [Tulasnella sp. 419]|nr:hypothetical protein FRC03_009532 [Tulasnella sp. 419]
MTFNILKIFQVTHSVITTFLLGYPRPYEDDFIRRYGSRVGVFRRRLSGASVFSGLLRTVTMNPTERIAMEAVGLAYRVVTHAWPASAYKWAKANPQYIRSQK